MSSLRLVRIITSGIRHEVSEETLERSNVSTRLLNLLRNASKEDGVKVIRVDRPADCFAAVLSLCETGELHVPPGVCPGAFQSELRYWDVDPVQHLANCCQFRYHSFFECQETLNAFKSFRESSISGRPAVVALETVSSPSGIARFRSRVWSVVDNRESSLLSKVYLLALFSMVMASIFITALGTVPSLRRKLGVCELLEYMEHSQSDKYEAVFKALGEVDCVDGPEWFGDATIDYVKIDGQYMYLTRANVSNKDDMQDERNQIKIRLLKVRHSVFDIFDIVMVTFFTLDFIARILSCESLPRYFTSWLNLLDVLALLGFYIHLGIDVVKREEKYLDNWVDRLDFMQIFRVFRIFRVVKHIKASQVFAFSIRMNSKDLCVLVMFLIIGVTGFASVVYLCESRADIDSVPLAWWWAVVTMTTVGYGDIVPKTAIGRVTGCLCAVSGVVLVSLTLPIFVNNFISLYQYASVIESLQRKGRNRENWKKGLKGLCKVSSAVEPMDIEEYESEKKGIKLTRIET